MHPGANPDAANSQNNGKQRGTDIVLDYAIVLSEEFRTGYRIAQYEYLTAQSMTGMRAVAAKVLFKVTTTSVSSES